MERFATLLAEAAAPFAAAIKPNLAFFEAFGAAGMAALERIRGSLPADLPRPRRCEARRHRDDRGTTGRRAVRRARRRCRHGQPVPRRRGDRAAPRASGPVRLRPVPDARTRVPASCRTSSWARTPMPGSPAEPLHLRVARAGHRRGVPAGPSGSSSAPPRRPNWPRSARSPPVWPSSSRASGRRVGKSGPVLEHGRAMTAPGRRSARWGSPRQRLARDQRGGRG